MKCPACYASLDTAPNIGGAIHCPGCAHLWQLVDGEVLALNSVGTGYRAYPNPAPAGVGPLTAAEAAPLVEEEIA